MRWFLCLVVACVGCSSSSSPPESREGRQAPEKAGPTPSSAVTPPAPGPATDKVATDKAATDKVDPKATGQDAGESLPEAEPERSLVVLRRSKGVSEGGAVEAPFEGGLIRLRTAIRGRRVDVAVTGPSGSATTLKCDGSKPLLIEAELDEPHVHILCIRLSPEGKPMWTDGTRLRWNASKKRFDEAGGYEGEGRVDPGTIDLDE